MNDFDFTIEMFEDVAEREGWKRGERPSRFKEVLEQFAQTSNKTLKLNCPTVERAKTVQNCIAAIVKKNYLNMTSWRRLNYVYVIKL